MRSVATLAGQQATHSLVLSMPQNVFAATDLWQVVLQRLMAKLSAIWRVPATRLKSAVAPTAFHFSAITLVMNLRRH